MASELINYIPQVARFTPNEVERVTGFTPNNVRQMRFRGQLSRHHFPEADAGQGVDPSQLAVLKAFKELSDLGYPAKRVADWSGSIGDHICSNALLQPQAYADSDHYAADMARRSGSMPRRWCVIFAAPGGIHFVDDLEALLGAQGRSAAVILDLRKLGVALVESVGRPLMLTKGVQRITLPGADSIAADTETGEWIG